MATDVEQREDAMEHVYRLLDRSRGTWRVMDMLAGLLKTFAVFGGALVVGFLADNLLHLPGWVRLLYGIGALAALIAMVARFVLHPLLRPMTDEMVAAHVERALPESANRLINAVLLTGERFRDPLSRRLAVAQIRSTARDVRSGGLVRPAGTGDLRRPARWALGLAAFALLYGLIFTEHFGNAFLRFVHPTRYIPPITDTRLSVTPGDAELLQGDSLAVEARVGGLLPESARIEIDVAGRTAAEAMAFEGNAFNYAFSNVQQPFTYRVRAGDALTRRYVVTVSDRPAVQRVDLTYVYPAYTGMAELLEENSPGDIRAPVGTAVRLIVQADRPVQGGGIEVRPLTADAGEPAVQSPLVPRSETELRGELAVRSSGSYRIAVRDAGGVSNVPRVRQIEAVPDAAPRVIFEQPARDVAAAPDARVTLLAGVEDDFSLR